MDQNRTILAKKVTRYRLETASDGQSLIIHLLSGQNEYTYLLNQEDVKHLITALNKGLVKLEGNSFVSH